MKILSALCVSLGILLMVAAFVYPHTVKTESLWTQEQSQERIELGIAAHALACDHSDNHAHGPGQADAVQECDEGLMNRYNQLQAELDEARRRPQRVAAVLKWLGVACTLLGAVGYYATRTG